MRRPVVALAALALVTLVGCHSPEITFSGDEREVRSARIRTTTDLPQAEVDRVQRYLERSLDLACAHWRIASPPELACYLFAEPADFARFRDYDGLLRGGHARQAGLCLGFYCAGCEAFATCPELARTEPALDDPATWRPFEHVLAHELNHHLLDKAGGRGNPAWLSEGVAEVDGMRAWREVDGPRQGALAPSRIYETLALTAFALRGLYGELVLVDAEDRSLKAVTWGHEYHLDLAAALAIQDLDPALLRQLARGGELPTDREPVRFDLAVQARARLLASEALLEVARAHARAVPAVAAMLSSLWGDHTADGLEPRTLLSYWVTRLAGARGEALAGRPSTAEVALASRPGDRRAGLARARAAVWQVVEALGQVAPGAPTNDALADLELWLLGDLERRALARLADHE